MVWLMGFCFALMLVIACYTVTYANLNDVKNHTKSYIVLSIVFICAAAVLFALMKLT